MQENSHILQIHFYDPNPPETLSNGLIQLLAEALVRHAAQLAHSAQTTPKSGQANP